MSRYELLLQDQERLEQEKAEREHRLAQAPPGFLTANEVEGEYRYYQTSWDSNQKKKVRKYISAENHEVALSLAQKHEDRARLRVLERDLAGIHAYRKAYERMPVKEVRESNAMKLLLDELHGDLARELDEWMAAPYSRSQSYGGNLRHKTRKEGEYVRSKSEAMIARVLFDAGIPYRYEDALDLNGKIFHPDFTMRHPSTGEYFYWEHLGLMDEPDYVRRSLDRIRIFNLNHISPETNLILTYESQERPLDEEWVARLVQYYFGL